MVKANPLPPPSTLKIGQLQPPEIDEPVEKKENLTPITDEFFKNEKLSDFDLELENVDLLDAQVNKLTTGEKLLSNRPENDNTKK